MLKLLTSLLLTLAIALLELLSPAPSALAGDVANGAKVFGANCAACHGGGLNTVMPNKTLKKEALEQFGMNSAEAIITQVTNGKGVMPKFGGRLTTEQIEDVAAYVLAQAEKGW